MAQAVAKDAVLSDSTLRTRPDFKTLLFSDANAHGNSVSLIEKKRMERQMKFPKLLGRKEVDSMRNPQDISDPAYRKWNEEGNYRPDAPFRSCDNILDPVSGFVSIVGDLDRNTGHTRIANLVQLNKTPQSDTPQRQHSVRKHIEAAPPETKRFTENDPGAPYTWNSKKKSDALMRAELGGWTSEKDPRIHVQPKLRGEPEKTPSDEASELRDKLSLRYRFTSSTQRSFEEVPWDLMLKNKKWPPTKTLEDRPDMISQRWTQKKYEDSAAEWQKVGRSWDWFQSRSGYYKKDPLDIVFCTPCPRAQQIPNYGGSIGGVNLVEIDNAKEPFVPLTVKRVPIPRPTDTSHVPHIPRYTGCTLYRSPTAPVIMTQGNMGMETSTTGVHRPMEIISPGVAREAPLSKMVTTVPPYNAFKSTDKVLKEQIVY